MSRATLRIRGLVFTVLVPGVIGVYVPAVIASRRSVRLGWWEAGWLPVAAGSLIYGLCLLRFLDSGGTPAIFFTRPLSALIGEEPPALVQNWLYERSRNPMYLAVLLVVFGQAILFASTRVAVYGVGLWFFFHMAVVLQEEPHLRGKHGASYDEYCRRVPRWFYRAF